MSHQTGIQASDGLKSFLSGKDQDIRCIKIGIDLTCSPEQIVLLDSTSIESTFNDDFDQLADLTEEKQPCYLFYRFDKVVEDESPHEWLFVAYSPDEAEIRPKMLYSGTKSTMKLEFGPVLIKDEYFATLKSELSLHAYQKHLEGEAAPKPLTDREVELEEIKEGHNSAVMSGANRLPGVAIPINQDAVDALVSLRDGEGVNYVQLSIDMSGTEQIVLEKSEEIRTADLSKMIPDDVPRYHVFAFRHEHDTDLGIENVFIYSMPSKLENTSAKERMVYSTAKTNFVACCKFLELEIKKNLEVDEDDAKELNAEKLLYELHPPKPTERKKFDKPKGPGGRPRAAPKR